MKILCLYHNDIALELFEWIKFQGHETVLYQDWLASDWIHSQNFDFSLSYTYRYIIKPDVIEALNSNIVNLHTSYLPFNRGADPNIWSIIDDTPRGVTLHYIDPELDHGDIISQAIVPFGNDETLASSYRDLDRAAKDLFKNAFRYYRFWDAMRKKSSAAGTYHKSAEAGLLKEQIPSYDIGIMDFKTIAAAGLKRKGD